MMQQHILLAQLFENIRVVRQPAIPICDSQTR